MWREWTWGSACTAERRSQNETTRLTHRRQHTVLPLCTNREVRTWWQQRDAPAWDDPPDTQDTRHGTNVGRYIHIYVHTYVGTYVWIYVSAYVATYVSRYVSTQLRTVCKSVCTSHNKSHFTNTPDIITVIILRCGINYLAKKIMNYSVVVALSIILLLTIPYLACYRSEIR
jgi:hypothetical protein